MSSCLNSAAAVTWQDIVSTYGQKFSEAKKTLVTKYLGIALHCPPVISVF